MERLTNDQLEAIRKRAEAAKDFDVFGDVPKLLAEIDRLRGQLSEAREYNEYYFDLCKERKREIERLKYALEVIANSDGWLIEPAPLCTIEEAYERCVDTATKAIYGGDSE